MPLASVAALQETDPPNAANPVGSGEGPGGVSVTGLNRRAVARGRSKLAVIRAAVSETELAQALLRGDPWAPRQTWTRYVNLVRKVVRGKVGCGPDVEDVVQEVFLRLFARVGALRHPESLRSFVISFAVRIGKWARRDRRRQRWLRLTDTGNFPDDELLAVEIENQCELGRLYRLLDRFPLRERCVLLLRHLDGMKLTEIAPVMKLSLATVKRVLKRASLRLAELHRESGQPRRLRRIARPRRPAGPIANTAMTWVPTLNTAFTSLRSHERRLTATPGGQT
jgi:RNA polymerase sigma-70 factor (ECF subfamily)